MASNIQDLRYSPRVYYYGHVLVWFIRFQSTAIMALQEAAEAYLTTLFEVQLLILPLRVSILLPGYGSLCYPCKAGHDHA